MHVPVTKQILRARPTKTIRNKLHKLINFVALTNCFEGKKFFFYCQIMVLNFTRNANSLVLMSHYIAAEQDLPAYLQ